MFKKITNQQWFFDCEWIPDVESGRLLYNLPPDLSDLDVMKEMWLRNGATEENPQPFLKMILCRVISIAVLRRRVDQNGKVLLNLFWLPSDVTKPEQNSEKTIIERFLGGIGSHRPQLVGFNSRNSDLKILFQRAVVNGIFAKEYCARPNKPWEGEDYFAKDNDIHIDMMEYLSGFGKGASVSLDEIATLSGIPGKFDSHGQDVAQMWLTGKWQDVIRYNCFDALTTYLVWLRMAHLGGFITTQEYKDEQETLATKLFALTDKPETEFLGAYLDEWDRLRSLRRE